MNVLHFQRWPLVGLWAELEDKVSTEGPAEETEMVDVARLPEHPRIEDYGQEVLEYTLPSDSSSDDSDDDDENMLVRNERRIHGVAGEYGKYLSAKRPKKRQIWLNKPPPPACCEEYSEWKHNGTRQPSLRRDTHRLERFAVGPSPLVGLWPSTRRCFRQMADVDSVIFDEPPRQLPLTPLPLLTSGQCHQRSFFTRNHGRPESDELEPSNASDASTATLRDHSMPLKEERDEEANKHESESAGASPGMSIPFPLTGHMDLPSEDYAGSSEMSSDENINVCESKSTLHHVAPSGEVLRPPNHVVDPPTEHHPDSPEETREEGANGDETANTSHRILFPLFGKLVTIIGGGQGEGITLAGAVLDAGGHVACVDNLHTPAAEEWAVLQQAAKQSNLEVFYRQCDVTNDAAVRKAMDEIDTDVKRLGAQVFGPIVCSSTFQERSLAIRTLLSSPPPAPSPPPIRSPPSAKRVRPSSPPTGPAMLRARFYNQGRTSRVGRSLPRVSSRKSILRPERFILPKCTEYTDEHATRKIARMFPSWPLYHLKERSPVAIPNWSGCSYIPHQLLHIWDGSLLNILLCNMTWLWVEMPDREPQAFIMDVHVARHPHAFPQIEFCQCLAAAGGGKITVAGGWPEEWDAIIVTDETDDESSLSKEGRITKPGETGEASSSIQAEGKEIEDDSSIPYLWMALRTNRQLTQLLKSRENSIAPGKAGIITDAGRRLSAGALSILGLLVSMGGIELQMSSQVTELVKQLAPAYRPSLYDLQQSQSYQKKIINWMKHHSAIEQGYSSSKSMLASPENAVLSPSQAAVGNEADEELLSLLEGQIVEIIDKPSEASSSGQSEGKGKKKVTFADEPTTQIIPITYETDEASSSSSDLEAEGLRREKITYWIGPSSEDLEETSKTDEAASSIQVKGKEKEEVTWVEPAIPVPEVTAEEDEASSSNQVKGKEKEKIAWVRPASPVTEVTTETSEASSLRQAEKEEKIKPSYAAVLAGPTRTIEKTPKTNMALSLTKAQSKGQGNKKDTYAVEPTSQDLGVTSDTGKTSPSSQAQDRGKGKGKEKQYGYRKRGRGKGKQTSVPKREPASQAVEKTEETDKTPPESQPQGKETTVQKVVYTVESTSQNLEETHETQETREAAPSIHAQAEGKEKEVAVYTAESASSQGLEETPKKDEVSPSTQVEPTTQKVEETCLRKTDKALSPSQEEPASRPFEEARKRDEAASNQVEPASQTVEEPCLQKADEATSSSPVGNASQSPEEAQYTNVALSSNQEEPTSQTFEEAKEMDDASSSSPVETPCESPDETLEMDEALSPSQVEPTSQTVEEPVKTYEASLPCQVESQSRIIEEIHEEIRNTIVVKIPQTVEVTPMTEEASSSSQAELTSQTVDEPLKTDEASSSCQVESPSGTVEEVLEDTLDTVEEVPKTVEETPKTDEASSSAQAEPTSQPTEETKTQDADVAPSSSQAQDKGERKAKGKALNKDEVNSMLRSIEVMCELDEAAASARLSRRQSRRNGKAEEKEGGTVLE
ncbi:hypothetical protein F5Y03DRAFT_402989 [Xylaria venustula]|nr:hypothetical protein F5Y03DRAFT_402989 [Xylaria venustula]